MITGDYYDIILILFFIGIGLGPILTDLVTEDDVTFEDNGHLMGARKDGIEPVSDAYSCVWGSFEQVHRLMKSDRRGQ